MNGRAFLDTNILVYFYSENEAHKRNIVYRLLNTYDCVTSIQALNEASNVWIRKCGWSGKKIINHLDNIVLVCDKIMTIQQKTMYSALDLNDRYGYSYYDCLMLASALEDKCDIILTEDMSDGQKINDELTIINPFKGVF